MTPGEGPELEFRVEGVEPLEYAAAPTLLFRMEAEERRGGEVTGVTLSTQVRIAAAARRCTAAERRRLRELFGAEERWAGGPPGLLWAHTVAHVPAFTGRARFGMPLPCTCDLEVASARYFQSLDGGDVPLELLFSGTVYYPGEGGLRAARIPWDREARCSLPLAVWRRAMDRAFPNSAWLRLRRDLADRLLEYRSRRCLPSWDAALEALLEAAGEGAGEEERPWTA